MMARNLEERGGDSKATKRKTDVGNGAVLFLLWKRYHNSFL